MTAPSPTLAVDRAHLSFRLRSLFFPFDIPSLEPWITAEGYQLQGPLTRGQRPGVPSGLRLTISGPIAEHPETGCTLMLNSERSFVTIEGPNIDQVLFDFSSLETWLDELHIVDLATEIRFFEFILDGNLYVGSERNPTETIAGAWSSSPLVSTLSEQLTRHLTNFGIRLVDKGKSTGEDEWFEVRIEPSVTRPTTTFFVNMVFRHPSKTLVEETARTATGLLDRVIAEMERSATSE